MVYIKRAPITENHLLGPSHFKVERRQWMAEEHEPGRDSMVLPETFAAAPPVFRLAGPTTRRPGAFQTNFSNGCWEPYPAS